MQILFQEDISAIFRVADKDNSGTLTVKEIKDVLDDICERYPQVELYLKSKQMKDFIDLFKDANGNAVKESKELNIEEFKKALADVDSRVKMLPATAQVYLQLNCLSQRQGRIFSRYYFEKGIFFHLLSFVCVIFQVAAQQGNYLAKCFNKMKICEENPEGPLRMRGSGRHRFHPFR